MSDPGVLTVGQEYTSRGPDPRRVRVLRWDDTVCAYMVERIEGPPLIGGPLIAPAAVAAGMWQGGRYFERLDPDTGETWAGWESTA